MKLFRVVTSMAIVLCAAVSLTAGELSMSIMAGAADDRGLVKNSIDYLNAEMRAVEKATAGTDVTEMESFYMPVLSAGISYIHEHMYFSIGWEYSSFMFLKPQGEISTPTFTDNKLEMSVTRHTFPVFIGFALKYDNDNLVYFAGGINFTYSNIKITQSNPGALSSLGSESNTYESFMGGAQFKIGARSRMGKNISLSIEMISYMGKTIRSESTDELSKADTQMTGYEILAGIDYRVRLF